MMAAVALAECLDGVEARADDIKKLRSIVSSAKEPSVQRYLVEALCCFAVGAYRAAIVIEWCAVADHLRRVIEATGFEIAREYYRDEEDTTRREIPPLAQWDGRSLYRTCDRLHIFPRRLFETLDPLYVKRCACAHPTDEHVTASDPIRLLEPVQWLIQRPVQEERIQEPGLVLKAMQRIHLDLSRAIQLVRSIADDQVETFATTTLEFLLSSDRFLTSDDRRDSKVISVSDDHALTIWRAVAPALKPESRVRLMMKLSKELERNEIDDVVEILDVGRWVIFWPELQHLPAVDQERIWQYLDARLQELTRPVAEMFVRYAPKPYRSRAQAEWPQLTTGETL